MPETILLRNIKIPVDGAIVEGSILIEDGFIRSISRGEKQADRVLDGGGLLVLPGGVDIHAHVYDPQYTAHEDWESGSLAALYGGITTLIDMPLRVYVDNVDVLGEKIREAGDKSYVNYGITGGFLNENNYKSISTLRKHGVVTYKLFTCRPFKPIDERSIPRILREVRENNVLLIVHAEDEGLVDYGEEVYGSRSDILAYHMSRSGFAEASAIMKIGYTAAETGARIHIAHLSSAEGVEAVRYLKRRGIGVTAETCPHYLYFTREDSLRYGNFLKMAPTLKTSIDREALWRAIREGVVEVYASDNAPSPRELKQRDVWSAWGGIPNLEIMGPFLYTHGVREGRIDLDTYIRIFSENPAKLLGLYPLIGSITPGSIADLVVIDTRSPRKITANTHHHKVDWTPWEGLELYGHPRHVLVSGNVILENGEVVGKPGLGIYIGDLVVKASTYSTRLR